MDFHNLSFCSINQIILSRNWWRLNYLPNNWQNQLTVFIFIYKIKMKALWKIYILKNSTYLLTVIANVDFYILLDF